MTEQAMMEFVGPARTILHSILWAGEMLAAPDLLPDGRRGEYEAMIARCFDELAELYEREMPRMRLAS